MLDVQKNRATALEYYYQHREKINIDRALSLDKRYQRALRRETQGVSNERQRFFGAIQRLDKQIGNRAARGIKRILRRRLQQAFKSGFKFSKTARELLGCEISELKQHLESLWKPGMSWKNYGYYGWHIDHIMPCAKFDLNDPAQRQQCFHWSNLQPLWMKENFAKRDS